MEKLYKIVRQALKTAIFIITMQRIKSSHLRGYMFFVILKGEITIIVIQLF